MAALVILSKPIVYFQWSTQWVGSLASAANIRLILEESVCDQFTSLLQLGLNNGKERLIKHAADKTQQSRLKKIKPLVLRKKNVSLNFTWLRKK